MTMYYNRTLRPALLDALRPDGAFKFLAKLTRTWHLTDLQLRAYPGKAHCWATLYVGLTKVLDVHARNKTFWLVGKIDDPAWDPAWKQGHPLEWFADQPVEAYVRGAIGRVPDRFTHEGAVQAMLCTRASHLFSVIDREAVIGFEDTPSRTATYEALQAPLRAACPPDPSAAWFKPKRFGGELDLLAVDDDGRVLVIEVKPASTVDGIAWSPLQATFYSRLFRAWVAEVGHAAASEVLRSMLQQRVELSLSGTPMREVRTPIQIVPIVAIGGTPSSKQALPRLHRVQKALRDAGVGEADLEVWIVEDSVRRTSVLEVEASDGSE